MDDFITVKAKLSLLSTVSGGRKSPIISGYRPSHVFEHIGKRLTAYPGDIFFTEERINPGEDKEVTVRFHNAEQVKKYITAGKEWWVYEGWHLVGEGEIIEIAEGDVAP